MRRSPTVMLAVPVLLAALVVPLDAAQSGLAHRAEIGFQIGALAPTRFESGRVHLGASEEIDGALRENEVLNLEIIERLGGVFTVGRRPAELAIDPVLIIGASGGFAFGSRWRLALGLSSYKATASATLPFMAGTLEGGVTREGRLRTDFTGIAADLGARYHFMTGRMVPFIGAGLRLNRISPGATEASIEGIDFEAAETEPWTDAGLVIEAGLRHRIGRQILLEAAVAASGRRLEQASGDRFAVEPQFRAGFVLDLAGGSEQTFPPGEGAHGEETPGEEAPPDSIPPHEPPIAPPPEGKGCVISSEIEPFPPISARLLHPAEEAENRPYTPFASYALVADAHDFDRLVQHCRCEDEEGSAEKPIKITDPIRYEWVKESGDGSLDYRQGPAALYHLPDLEVGDSDRATFLCTVRDGRANDEPETCRVSVDVKRKSACGFTRTVEILDRFPEYGLLETSHQGTARCVPGDPAWKPEPPFLKDLDIPAEICARGLRLFHARSPGGDLDQIALACAGVCGKAAEDRELPDENVYVWTAARGAFAGPRGVYWESITTNSLLTDVVYLAPEEAGADTLTIEFRDSGTQGVDPPQLFTRTIAIAEVDLAIVDDGVYMGGVSEDFEACDGGTIAVNNDDDDEDGKKDLDDRQIPGEDDLMEIELRARGISGGVVTFDVQSGEKRVRVWEKPTKGRQVRTPKDYRVSSLPKRLWVEGITPSALKRDVLLTLRGGPGCLDEAVATVVPWCADADPSCDWTIHTTSWEGGEEGIIEGIGSDVADAQAGWTADCEARNAAGFGRCMRQFFDKNPACCCIMDLVIVGHGPDCEDDPDHCKGCVPGTPSGLGGGADTWTNDESSLWASFLCDSAKIEYRKCNGYYESFFWEFAARMGAGHEVKAYTEEVRPLLPGLSDSKKFRVPKDARPGDGPALKELADCLTDTGKSAEEQDACREAWRTRHRK